MKTLAPVVVLLGTAGFAQATGVITPEIDANSVVAGLTLVSGAVLVVRGRRKR